MLLSYNNNEQLPDSHRDILSVTSPILGTFWKIRVIQPPWYNPEVGETPSSSFHIYCSQMDDHHVPIHVLRLHTSITFIHIGKNNTVWLPCGLPHDYISLLSSKKLSDSENRRMVGMLSCSHVASNMTIFAFFHWKSLVTQRAGEGLAPLWFLLWLDLLLLFHNIWPHKRNKSFLILVSLASVESLCRFYVDILQAQLGGVLKTRVTSDNSWGNSEMPKTQVATDI